MNKLITLSPIYPTRENFSPYGTILNQPLKEPDFKTTKNHYWDKIACLETTDHILHPAYLRVFNRPFEFTDMEKHVKSSQAFIPLNGNRGIFAVAVDDGNGHPELESLKSFIMDGSYGLCLNSGVWHHLIFALDNEAEFILLVRDNTKNDDMNIINMGKLGIEKITINVNNN